MKERRDMEMPVKPELVIMRDEHDPVGVEIQRKLMDEMGVSTLAELQLKICRGCVRWSDGTGCLLRLFPITSTGEKCPYR